MTIVPYYNYSTAVGNFSGSERHSLGLDLIYEKNNKQDSKYIIIKNEKSGGANKIKRLYSSFLFKSS